MSKSRTATKIATLLLCSQLILTACSKTENGPEAKTVIAKNEKSEAEINRTVDVGQEVLARVNGQPITTQDLAVLLERVGGQSGAVITNQLLENAEYRKKLLEGLVNSRAMAALQEQRMDKSQKADLDRQVRLYRDELLVKQFLATEADPEPVTSQMVKDYYEQNQDAYREPDLYTFEVLTTYGEISTEQRQKVLQELENAREHSDWKAEESRMRQAQLPVRYQRAEARLKLLTESLQALVVKTPIGQTSNISVGDSVRVIRVLDKKSGQVKPLGEVSSEIRKKLAPVMMKKTIADVAEQARSQVEVEWTE